jgi:hypothetical protein
MRNKTRWTLTAATATAVVGGTLLVPAVANADPELPPTTAEELLTDLAAAEERSFSGTVVQTTDLGLPELPQASGTSGELSTLLAGSTTLRLWADGPERGRVAVLGALAETDVVRNGDDLYLWRSDERTALHATLPEEGQEDAGAEAAAGATTPGEAAQSALAALDPTTEVTLDGTTTVAGRDAYELVLTPRAQESLVGQVRLAVDAETSYPLRAQVIARGAGEPAFETGFTSISFTAPDEEVFAFEPPPGTTVEEVDPEAFAGTGGHQDGAPEGAAHDGQQPTVVGEGWASVVVLRDAAGALDPAAAGGQGGGDEGGAEIGSAILAGFQPVQGDFGSGRVLSTSLVSVLALDDGRVLMGAVAPEVLERAALDPAATP